MKLHTIKVLHAAPKDQLTAIEGYVIADTEEQVFDHVNRLNLGFWTDSEREIEEEDGTTLSMVDYVKKNRGDLDDDDGYEDAYYGVTKYGWDEGIEITPAQHAVLTIELGIATDIRQAA